MPGIELRAPDIAAPPHMDEAGFRKAHASPAVRAFARELGVDLASLRGSGPKERILREDVQGFVKQVISGTSKISGANLARDREMIPHVTHHDDADITELEALRLALNKENEKSGIRITMLAFLIKAVVYALQKYPDFNASPEGDNPVLKKYVNIGFAADTPNGLVVPVIKQADKRGVLDIAQEMQVLSARAREGKLGPTDMQGGCFSISSLGAIGGTYFTPVINAPEVAILGVCRAQIKPVWDGRQFVPRLMLPLSLSCDHRVIDGASAARFATFVAAVLADFRRVLMT